MPSHYVTVSTAVLRLARELRASLDRAFAETGLTSQQAALILHVFGGESSPSALAGLLGIDTAGITRMLDRLEAKGLLSRGVDRDDRRAIRVRLTSAGEELAPSLPAVFDRVSSELVGSLDLARVSHTLKTMSENLAQGDPR